MSVDGVGGKQPINNSHTMESLNIKKGTYEASIFNEIDKLDGKEDGYLTDLQYFVYQTRVSIEKKQRRRNETFRANRKRNSRRNKNGGC